MAITTKFERITPQKAKQYLEANLVNRPLKSHVVNRFVHAIRAGHWQETHQGIAFNGDGQLIDGQHRLTAVCRTGLPIRVQVSRGISTAAFKVIDTGAVRSPSDHLALLGYKNTNVLARALHLQFMYDNQQGDIETRMQPDKAPDKDDLLAVAEEHPMLVAMTSGSDGRETRNVATPAIWSFLAYQFSLRDADLAAEFMDALSTGASLRKDSIVLLTRNRCVSITADVRARRRPVAQANIEKASLIVRAWNAVRAGNEHSVTKVQSRRISTAFPAIR